jgi:Zn-dependent protease with chaperone function
VVLAHEFGHLSHDHILKALAWMALLAVPMVGLLLLVSPLQNAFSRRRGGRRFSTTTIPV